MKRLAVIGFIVALSIGCVVFWQHFKHPSDNQISRQLPGIWISDPQSTNDSVTIDPNGSFAIDEIFGTNKIAYEGTWEVKDGFMVATTTKSTFDGQRVGTVTRDKIIRVNGKELVFFSHDTTITWKRRP